MTEQEIQELQARLATLENEKAALKQSADDAKAAADKLKSENANLKKVAKAEAAKTAPVSFEVEEDKESDIEGGEYEFTAPTLHWDDNTVINVREMANSKDEKDQEKFALICAALVARKSGLVKRKED